MQNQTNIYIYIYLYIYIYIYIYCLFLIRRNKTKTQPCSKISFQTKLRECFSNYLGLAKFFRFDRFEETIDWSKLLKFGRNCSKWQGRIAMNTETEESTIFKAETDSCWPQEKLKHTKTTKYNLTDMTHWT